MLNVEIKYNPYTVKTDIVVDGVPVEKGHRYMQLCENRRLQDWIDALLLNIYEDERDGEIKLLFKGLSLDGEDVKDAARQLKADMQAKNIDLDITIEVDAKEADSKRTKALQDLFEEGKSCPYPEVAQLFRTGKMQKAFDDAMNTIFEANVVATMSSGKSTFINSLLGQELMPAANEATTATIARIINRDIMNDFRGQRFNGSGNPISEPNELLNLQTMTEWNKDPETSFIDIEGNIPTISQTDSMTIAFVDTPGPNNSRNEEHYRKTVEAITSKPLSMIIYILNGTQLNINDDKNLLNLVREAMEKGGRQAQDRFVFVANKFDEFDPERENIGEALEKVKQYLRDNGINNPLVIPVSALLALLLRKKIYLGINSLTGKQKGQLANLSCCFLDMPEYNMTNYVRSDMNPRNIRLLEKMLEEADNDKNDDKKLEILSGVPVVEMLLNDFLQKHAVPAKLKDAVDSFKVLADLENQIKNTSEVLDVQEEELKKSIEILEGFRTSEERIKMADEFRDIIKNDVYEISEDTERELIAINTKAETLISNVTERLTKSSRVTPERAEEMIELAAARCKEFAIETTVVLTDSLEKEHISKLNDMKQQYEEYAAKVLEKSFPANSPLKKLQMGLMTMPDPAELVRSNTKTESKEIVTGTRWVPPVRKWYNPFSWFRSGYSVDVKKTVTETYVDMQPIVDDFAAVIRQYPQRIQADFEEKANENLRVAKDALLSVMDGIDAKMAEVTMNLQKALADEEVKKTAIAESKKQLEWLCDFNQKLDNILAV